MNLTPEQKEALAVVLNNLAARPPNWRERVDMLLAALPAHGLALVPVSESGGWISVEERLPETQIEVLLTNGDGQWVGYFHGGRYWTGDCSFYIAHVTHWRPLPPLPGAKEAEPVARPVADTQRCPVCGGEGVILMHNLWEECEGCRGSGTVPGKEAK